MVFILSHIIACNTVYVELTNPEASFLVAFKIHLPPRIEFNVDHVSYF